MPLCCAVAAGRPDRLHDWKHTGGTGEAVGSRDAIPPAEHALEEVLTLATAISGARDLPSLLQRILTSARQLTLSDAGSIYLVEPGDGGAGGGGATLRFATFQNGSLGENGSLGTEDGAALPPGVGAPAPLPVSAESLVGWAVLSGEVLAIEDVYAIPADRPYRFDRRLDRLLGYRARSMLVVPLRTTAAEVVGVMQLINRRCRPGAERLLPGSVANQVRAYDAADQRLIDSLAGLAGVCVERTRLLEAQQRQIDSMIGLLAGAIDAKSAHTGRHCSRVPELAVMLAEAAEEECVGRLAGFRFSDAQQWREFRTAAWLHDCGKVITPDLIVDKATKLDAPSNRIHEIRTRFEVLRRDLRIAQLEGLLAGGDAGTLQHRHDTEVARLEDDFAFIARCNLGSEGMAEADLERLRSLAGRTWLRHFDDRLGLGWEERNRCPEPPPPLPAPEPLLADLPRHRIRRPAEDLPDPRWGFTLQPTALLYDQGELHNLSVRRGTLTAEEIYKVREHMVQTVIMLESIEFPPGLARVAEIAGAHHETLDGSGYPRSLRAEQLSIPARILAIADIFEALTASDRPYKRGKPLSEALAILAAMRDAGRIDGDLLALLERSGVARRFAERFLPPEQNDLPA